MAMVVFEAEAGGGAGDHPRARAVFADVERDLDLVFAAGAHLHDEGLAGEGGVGGAGAFDDFSSVVSEVRFAASRRAHQAPSFPQI